MRVCLGLVAVLFVACHCNGCKSAEGARTNVLHWEARRTDSDFVEEADLFDGKMLGGVAACGFSGRGGCLCRRRRNRS